MQRALTAALGAAVMALPTANAVAAVERSAAAAATPKKIVVTRKVSGSAVEADRWGAVTVTRHRAQDDRRRQRRQEGDAASWIDIGGTFTYHTDRSLYIMQQALPQLRQQALQSHSANVDMISGATYTSEAFVQSMQEALVKANKV